MNSSAKNIIFLKLLRYYSVHIRFFHILHSFLYEIKSIMLQENTKFTETSTNIFRFNFSLDFALFIGWLAPKDGNINYIYVRTVETRVQYEQGKSGKTTINYA